MRESVIERTVTAYAKKQGWLTCKIQGQHNRGFPDRLFFRDRVLICVEFKATGRKPTQLQAHVHQKLINSGFSVHVIDSIENGKQLLA